MPDPNQTNQNQTNPTIPSLPTDPILPQTPNPVTSMQPDLPPLPPDFQNTPTTPPAITPETTPPARFDVGGSAAPNPLPPPMSVTPKKKFGGGRIIATILGLFLLVGGIGAGIVLTQNQQLFQQKAAGILPIVEYCGTGLNCQTRQVAGAVACKQTATGPTIYCCPSGQTVKNGVCTDTSGNINCGGTQCNINDCHCQGGDACTSLKCEPGLGTNCTGQGRSWCDNYQAGIGKTCCQVGYVCNTAGQGCVPSGTSSTPKPRGGGTDLTASCQGTKVYSSAFVELTSTQVSGLKSGDTINFCVSGTTSAGNFDKAKFTINGVAQPETTTKRPGSNDFCQSYTIKPSDTTVHAVGQIHHVTLGWEQ